jgi:hypothetical protein
VGACIVFVPGSKPWYACQIYLALALFLDQMIEDYRLGDILFLTNLWTILRVQNYRAHVPGIVFVVVVYSL